MKKIDELMAELGFNKNAPVGVKEAFIKHLIKASEGVNIQTPSEREEMSQNPQKVIPLIIPQQMSFEFAEDIHVRPKKQKLGNI